MRAFNPTFQASMATGRGAKPIDAAQASLRELCSVLESSESEHALQSVARGNWCSPALGAHWQDKADAYAGTNGVGHWRRTG